MFDHIAEDFKKRVPHQLKIFKMFDHAAEDFKKKTTRELKILRKDRHRPVSGSVKPTDNHHKLRRRLCELCARAGKSSAGRWRFLKKIGSVPENSGKRPAQVAENFKKKIGSIPENSGKRPARQLSISKKIGSIPENSGKRPAQQLSISKKDRIGF
jgi:hypothetical protein